MSRPKTPWERVKLIEFQMLTTAIGISAVIFFALILGINPASLIGIGMFSMSLALCVFAVMLQAARHVGQRGGR